MKLIKMLSEMIEEELDGAEEYVHHAIKTKETNPALAKTFYDISMQEMDHVSKLHDEVVKIIDTYRKEHGDPPEVMMAVYEYMHERHMKQANTIKNNQAHYRET